MLYSLKKFLIRFQIFTKNFSSAFCGKHTAGHRIDPARDTTIVDFNGGRFMIQTLSYFNVWLTATIFY